MSAGLQIRELFKPVALKRSETIILIKVFYEYTLFNKYNHQNVEKCIRFCVVSIKTLKIYLICIYRSEDFITFLDVVERIVSELDQNKKVIEVDEFNVPFDAERGVCVRLWYLLDINGEACLDVEKPAWTMFL